MVFGTGQVGHALAAVLAGRGLTVRVVSRHRPPELADGIDWRAADATDTDAASDAAKGAAVVYQCLNAPYTQWPERFPPLQRGVLAAAERNGALLVSLENLYGYGPAGGKPMTEDLPLAATTVKGRTRAAMTGELLAAAADGRVRVAIGRASDFFGPGVTAGSTLGERVFGNALAGRRADFIGDPDLPHTYSYVPDIAAGLATLGTDARAAGQVWHLPGPATVTTRALLDLVAAEVGHPVGIRSVPKLAVRALGLVNPMMRELAEMSYEFDEPFVLDTSKYQAAFGTAGTPLAVALAATVAWYRTRPSRHDTRIGGGKRHDNSSGRRVSGIGGNQHRWPDSGCGVVEAGATRGRVHPGRLRRLLAGAGEPDHRRTRRRCAARGVCRRRDRRVLLRDQGHGRPGPPSSRPGSQADRAVRDRRHRDRAGGGVRAARRRHRGRPF